MPSEPLVVAATAAEAAHVPPGLSVLVTGIGKVQATLVTALALAERRPSVVLNVGTAGALGGATGLRLPSRVLNHDFSAAELRLLGYDAVDEIEIAGGDGTVLASGDTFVNDPAVRDLLAQRAALVDMEGFAVAAVARHFDVPVRLVKHVSDQADESAMDWPQVVDASARVLGEWLSQNA
ncbi:MULTISPECIES: nucleosidase [Mumia]|uniref:nucleosidase n=1 Tax=Mumia TaxID=1546255 RepID=UPI00141EA86E|nr:MULTISPECIES: nucleosidase [unclassified Mumia]QMW65471.1 nucleosidase [Mumia sp. ZJ1417]